MRSVLEDFSTELDEGQLLAILPISRFIIEEHFRYGQFFFYPAGEINLDELRIQPPSENVSVDQDGIVWLGGQALRESLSSLTGNSQSILAEHALVAFPFRLDWNHFLQADHKDDVRLIRRLTEHAEQAMDLIRFHFCEFHLPDTLPGRVGTWENSGPYCCALLYNRVDHESDLIAGVSIVSAVIKGLGLELVGSQCENLTLPGNQGTVGAIVRRGLSLFSDVFEANSETVRFGRVMTLFEFLACPGQYSKMRNVKTAIAAHVACRASDYHRISERFRELTNKKEAGSDRQLGIRTRIIHHGEYLEDILPSENDRNELFRELQNYGFRVLTDLLERSGQEWADILDYRMQRLNRFGVRRMKANDADASKN